jgi:hypothetical protein
LLSIIAQQAAEKGKAQGGKTPNSQTPAHAVQTANNPQDDGSGHTPGQQQMPQLLLCGLACSVLP